MTVKSPDNVPSTLTYSKMRGMVALLIGECSGEDMGDPNGEDIGETLGGPSSIAVLIFYLSLVSYSFHEAEENGPQ